MKKQSWQSALLSLTLVLISIHSVFPESNCIDGSQIPQANYTLPNEKDVRFLSTSNTIPEGIQVIVPQMSFRCTGRITGWSAHTLAFALPAFIEQLTHIITFQVWRPSDSTPNSYSLVGSNSLRFSGSELVNGITAMNSTEQTAFFTFANKTVSQKNEIYFQPGDVLGWYISPQLNTIVPPLIPLFRAPHKTDNLVVDMFVNGATLESSTLCSVRETFEVYSTVVPLVSVIYQVGSQERPLTKVCNRTAVPMEVEITTANRWFTTTSNTPRQIKITDIFLIAIMSIMSATLVLHIIMIFLCALNLSATKDIRKYMKSGITPMTPPFMSKQPITTPNKSTEYEMVQTLGNYEMVATKSTYDTVVRLEKHGRTNDEHLHMLQPSYDTESSPELERNMTRHNSKSGNKDKLTTSDSRK